MSDKFNGFSQDEIRKLQTHPKTNSTTTTNAKPAFRGGLRRVPDKVQTTKKLQQQQQLHPQMVTNKKENEKIMEPAALVNDTLDDTNVERSMSKSLEDALFFQPLRKESNVTTTNEALSNESSILQLTTNAKDTSDSMLDFKDNTLPTLPMTAETLPNSNGSNQNALNLDSPFKGISLKDFESHRKMIEEQNKQKKELLHKAIEQYSQKTAAEARKIEEIKSELSKLDNDLALDVAILRKQIDMACMHFTNVEKQYMKIETQFLKAKMDLHNAAERKELLTEHLCTVIAHNEDRKAQKLSELMQKVGLSAPDDYDDVQQQQQQQQQQPQQATALRPPAAQINNK